MKKIILFALTISLFSCSKDNNNNSGDVETDTVAPIITLLGEAVVTVGTNGIYTDAGATAADNVDGDITASIIVNGEVNTAVNGTYTLTYNVSDAAGNEAESKTRTVNVEEIRYTYIPDDKFEIELIALGYDDVLDDYVSTYNIRSVTQLDLKQLNILDLTGIQDFVALKTLDCSNNLLDTIEATYNLNLKSLNCSHNNLSTIDVSNFTSLEYFNCDFNTISSIDLSQNLSLRQLYCSNNLFNTLDVSLNTALVNLSFSNNYLTEIDISQNINLETLICVHNNISSIDFSNNASLKRLICQHNLFQTLDVSPCTSLEYLKCKNNQIETLIIPPNNTSMTFLHCGYNKITALDVSQLTNLEWFSCDANELTALNVANGNNENMEFMYAVLNSDLTCIQIDEGFTPSPNAGWKKDSWVEYSINCP